MTLAREISSEQNSRYRYGQAAHKIHAVPVHATSRHPYSDWRGIALCGRVVLPDDLFSDAGPRVWSVRRSDRCKDCEARR
jgi:hypothetical protein